MPIHNLRIIAFRSVWKPLQYLNKALEYNPKDGKAYYYIGNILYDKQPGKAIASWENAIKNEPTLALAYRNLGWGYNRHAHDIKEGNSVL